jgi:hypothetical protein
MSYIILTPVIEVDQKYAGIEVRILHGIFQYFIAGWFITSHVFYGGHSCFIV